MEIDKNFRETLVLYQGKRPYLGRASQETLDSDSRLIDFI